MKTKRLSNTAIIIIILSSLALVFLSLSIIASALNVSRCKKSINEIGTVVYTKEVEEIIDTALNYYENLDRMAKWYSCDYPDDGKNTYFDYKLYDANSSS